MTDRPPRPTDVAPRPGDPDRMRTVVPDGVGKVHARLAGRQSSRRSGLTQIGDQRRRRPTLSRVILRLGPTTKGSCCADPLLVLSNLPRESMAKSARVQRDDAASVSLVGWPPAAEA